MTDYLRPTDEDKEERDALCPDCGRGFKAYIDRIMPTGTPDHDHTQHADLECPHCGCRECRLDDSVR